MAGVREHPVADALHVDGRILGAEIDALDAVPGLDGPIHQARPRRPEQVLSVPKSSRSSMDSANCASSYTRVRARTSGLFQSPIPPAKESWSKYRSGSTS